MKITVKQLRDAIKREILETKKVDEKAYFRRPNKKRPQQKRPERLSRSDLNFRLSDIGNEPDDERWDGRSSISKNSARSKRTSSIVDEAEETQKKKKKKKSRSSEYFPWPMRNEAKVRRLAFLKENIRLSQQSVDDQIDSILVRFEKDCIIDDDKGDVTEEGLIDLGRLMKEAPGDEEDEEKEDDEPKDDEKEDSDASDPDELEQKKLDDLTGDEDEIDNNQPSEPMKPKIDLKKFAGKVSRFITNHVNLLDVETAIANRSKDYLARNYDDAVGQEFDEILEKDFEIKTNRKDTSEPGETPIAIGAAASGLSG